MKITYLGTAAAEGVPAMYCNCQTCKKIRQLGGRELRTRSQILIDGTLGIDFPPDAYYHTLRFNVDLSAIENLLVTHSHMDHFYAHDFILRGYKYSHDLTTPVMHIYGNEEVAKVFAECTRRELHEDVAEGLPMSVIKPFESFVAGDFTVTAFPAVHSREEQALLYLIEKDGKGILHLCDTGKVTEETYQWLREHGKKVHLVTMDCTLIDYEFSRSGRHMSLKENAFVMARLRADGVASEITKFIITHFSHNSAPFIERLKAFEEQYGVTAAYDGMEIEI